MHIKVKKTDVLVLFLLLMGFFCTAGSALAEQMKEIRVKSVKVIRQDALGNNITYPASLYYDPVLEEVYGAIGGEGSLVVYGPDYFPELNIGGGRKVKPAYSVYVHKGQSFVCVGQSDERDAHIAVLDGSLLLVRRIFFSGFEGAGSFVPYRLVIGADDKMYVVAVNGSKVLVLDSEGRFLYTMEPKIELHGISEGASVVSLAKDSQGRLYFLSEQFSKVFVFDKDEKFLYSFGQKGGVQGKLARPRGIAVDDQRQKIYVTDYMRHAVSAYSLEGKYLFEFGGKGTSRGWFQYPTDVAVGSQGNILISDTFNHRIQVFEVEESIEETEIVGDIEDLQEELNVNREETGQIIAQRVDELIVEEIVEGEDEALKAEQGPAAATALDSGAVVITTPASAAEEILVYSDQRFSVKGRRYSAGGAPLKTLLYKKVHLPDFSFNFDSADLSERGKKALSQVLEELLEEKEGRILVRVEGHTDSKGSETYNDDLSIRRAEAAARYIVQNNILDEDRLFINGYSELQPIASNATPEGRAVNRRIELLILLTEEKRF